MGQPEKGLVIAGRYRLIELLADGGMGSVWVAQHVGLRSAVAVKFIGSAASPEARARFEREARAAAHIRNQHVVQVHDYGVDGDLPYIVMELLKGEDLGKRLTRQERLTLGQTLKILAQIVKALKKTHDEGIVHRDLKPGNVFLVREDDGEDLVKVVDFGIAKGTGPFITDDATKTGDLMGSPSYMSPEQISGAKDIDPRSDLWSLGVILYRAVTGRLPFTSDGDRVNLFLKICTELAPAATSIAPDLPPLLDKFFERAFAHDRRLRFQTAVEMKEAFEQIVTPADPSSNRGRATSTTGRSARWSRALAGIMIFGPLGVGLMAPRILRSRAGPAEAVSPTASISSPESTPILREQTNQTSMAAPVTAPPAPKPPPTIAPAKKPTAPRPRRPNASSSPPAPPPPSTPSSAPPASQPEWDEYGLYRKDNK